MDKKIILKVEASPFSPQTAHRSTLTLGPLSLEEINESHAGTIYQFLQAAANVLRGKTFVPGQPLSSQRLRELAAMIDSGKLVSCAQFHDMPDGKTSLLIQLDPTKGT